MRHERVNILHISDLHYCSDRNHDHDVVIQAFQNDLRRLPSELKPDLIVFSGDLVHSGDSSDSYYCVLTRVLNPLLDITGLGEGRVFLVPGNHDVQRSAIVADETTQNGLECTLTDRITLNEYYLNASGYEYLRNKFYNFMTLKELLYNTSVISADPYIESCYVRDINVALVALNTAWMSRAGLADRNDRSHLLFPEAAVQRALRSLPDTKAKILVGHHPLDWLADYSWQDLRRIFEREGLIYLHGHMHEPIAQNVRGTIGRCLAHQSGALFIDRDRYNGYAIISLDPESGHLEVNLRSYYERRGEFDVATNVVPEGRWYSSLEAEAFWSRLTPPFNGGDISRWLADRVRPELQARLDEGFSDRPLSEVFVPPRLSKRSPSSAISEDDELRDQQTCSMSDLVHGTENYLIVGKREYGKTTLLRQLALSLVNEHDTMPIAAVPCVVDFAEIKRGTNRFFALLRAQLPDTDGCNFTFSDVIKHGSLVVLVDDVNLADQTRRAVLLDFVKSNPTARFIFTTTPELFDSIGVVTTLEEGVPFTTVHMEPFNRGQMRRLVERWQLKPNVDRESLLDRLVNDIVHINVPLTAVNGTILLTIFEAQGDFTPINKSVLIQTFVETLLEKHSIEDTRRGTFDFLNKVHLLGHIAGYMAKHDAYRIDHDELVRLARAYFKDIGFPDRSGEQIENFIRARIFAMRDGKVSFRYRAFLEYFIAAHMEQQEIFKTWVLEEDQYLSFWNEIEYYAGIRRSDVALLKLFRDRFTELTRQIREESEWDVDIDAISDITPPHEDLRSAWFEDIERQLRAPRLRPEERDELLDAELPRDVGDRQEVFRPLFEELGERWTACLFVYSAVLKNLELVPDAEKRLHLAEILAGWSEFTCHTLLLVPQLVKHRKLKVNGVEYHVAFPDRMSDAEVARGLYLGLPRAISELMRFYLSTEKMEVQLKQPALLGGHEPLIIKFYRGCLCGDMRLQGFISVLAEVERALLPSRYLAQAFVWKLRRMLIGLPLTDLEDAELRKLLAGVVGRLVPGSATERGKRTSREMHKLERARLVRRLRLQVRKSQEE